MQRWQIAGWLALVLAAPVCAQQPTLQRRPQDKQPAAQAGNAPVEESEPPEEDESLKPKVYGFNPLQAEKEVKIGDFYFKRGNWTGAAHRFEEATKWNPMYAEAWRRLGDVRERVYNDAGAIEAYKKFLELAPAGKEGAKESEVVKKRLAELELRPKKQAQSAKPEN